MSKHLRELQARKTALVQEARSLTDLVAQEARDMNEEEVAAFEALRSRIDAASSAIERETLLIAEEAQLSVNQTLGPIVTDNREAHPGHGFESMGSFFQAVYQAQKPGAAIDDRLLIHSNRSAAMPSTFNNEAVGQDGGFLIPPQFSQELFKLSLSEDALLPMTDNVEISGNSMTFPKDETTPWGTNGIRAYWQGEATPAKPSKFVLGLSSLRLKKLFGFVPITDELLDDTSALSTYLPSKIAESIRWKTNEAILFGAGNGLPLGCLNTSATVTVPKEPDQPSNSLLPLNLAQMIARLAPGSYSRAVWLINSDVLPALFTLQLGNTPIYLPTGGQVGGIQVSPYGTLLGRPVFVSQHANSFCTKGDVLLIDLSYYQTITKAGGIQTATSMHLYFDSEMTAFRATFRMDGLPKLSAAIKPVKGANELSPFIQLGDR